MKSYASKTIVNWVLKNVYFQGNTNQTSKQIDSYVFLEEKLFKYIDDQYWNSMILNEIPFNFIDIDRS